MEGRHEEAFYRRANNRGYEGSRCRGKVAELCRKYGISDATYYNWKAKFGGMTVSDAQRLRALEAENAKLKRLLGPVLMGDLVL